ncbi:MAG: YetF domain-containing protein [Rivularia sp. (in: cyanobacteria)]
MEKWLYIDWQTIFIPSTSVAELFIRGSLVYLALFSVLRILPNRQIGTLGINDVLVVVLFAEAAQNAMASDYTSITEGVILVGTIIFWSYFLNWLGYKIPAVATFVSPPPLILVKDGRLIGKNMEQELLTKEELMSQLRQQGVESLEKVKKAYMEADGRISIITFDS